MKIKKVAWTSFLISSPSISVLTDPLITSTSNGAFPKTSTDIIAVTNYEKEIKENIIKDNGLDTKIVPEHRDKVMEIAMPGEFEVGGLMIRRGINSDFYIIDENTLRVVYMGGTGKNFDLATVKGIGDVDVLILPVGDGQNFMDFDTMEKVISEIDPAVLLPCAYKEDGKKENDCKSKDDFIKHFGFANVRNENFLNVTKKKVDEEEQQSVEVIFL